MKLSTKRFLVNKNISLKIAMKQFDSSKEGILFVVDKQRLIGSITGGDIRRWVLKNGNMEKPVLEMCNKKPLFVKEGYKNNEIKRLMLKTGVNSIPVLDNKGKISDVLFWHNVFGPDKKQKRKQIKAAVVVMAGGFGKRLDPFTRVLPKPLIPIGDKTIIETIIDGFTEYKINTFYLSVNYKSKIIKSYFEELKPPYKLNYINEKIPLGTAGSLRYLAKKIKSSFFLINCDTIIKEDYANIFEFHKKNKFDITLVSSIKNYAVPYGVCRLNADGSLLMVEEKPEYSFLANTGMYVIEPKCLKVIPRGQFFHITQVIQKIIDSGGRVGVFPIKSQSWMDVGEWDEYRKTINLLKASTDSPDEN